jgi:hypothetical protein
MTDLVDLSGRVIPKVGAAPELAFEDRAKQLPEPSGYRILCAIPEIEKTTEGGIIKAEITIHHEELLATVLYAAKLGPDCYKLTRNASQAVLGARKVISFSCVRTRAHAS